MLRQHMFCYDHRIQFTGVPAAAEKLTLFCAIDRAGLADPLPILRIVQGDAARADVLMARAAHDLELVLLLAPSIHYRLVCLQSAQIF